ncbi:Transcription initiation factor IIE subunit beta [Spathaspora sp. JA1]|nr:Transcription initiation factor IIE subunit beta [Spathaspora sp. JA1]
MSDLSAQLSAFKNKIKSGPSVTAARKPVLNVAPSPISSPVKKNGDTTNGVVKRSTNSSDSMTEVLKRQKLSSNAMSEMSGSHLSTQLHLAVEFIKEHDAPLPVSKLQNYLSFDITHTLLPLLREIDRIKYDANNGTLEYVSLHNIRNADDLLEFLRRQTTFKGTSVKDLRDGWAGCLTAINELEAENKILVLRNKKENAPRLVWANAGGELGTISDEFKDMWIKVKLPEPDALYQSLLDQGLKPTGADPSLIKKKPQQQEKKQKKARRGRITNVHMKGILKDYTQLV